MYFAAFFRVSRIILAVVVLAAFIGYILFETYEDFARLRALGGIALFVCIGLAISGKFAIKFQSIMHLMFFVNF